MKLIRSAITLVSIFCFSAISFSQDISNTNKQLGIIAGVNSASYKYDDLPLSDNQNNYVMGFVYYSKAIRQNLKFVSEFLVLNNVMKTTVVTPKLSNKIEEVKGEHIYLSIPLIIRYNFNKRPDNNFFYRLLNRLFIGTGIEPAYIYDVKSISSNPKIVYTTIGFKKFSFSYLFESGIHFNYQSLDSILSIRYVNGINSIKKSIFPGAYPIEEFKEHKVNFNNFRLFLTVMLF